MSVTLTLTLQPSSGLRLLHFGIQLELTWIPTLKFVQLTHVAVGHKILEQIYLGDYSFEVVNEII